MKNILKYYFKSYLMLWNEAAVQIYHTFQSMDTFNIFPSLLQKCKALHEKLDNKECVPFISTLEKTSVLIVVFSLTPD